MVADGVYTNNPTIVGSQQFDNGDENFEIDITTHVNNIITGGPLIMVGYFDPLCETIEQEVDQSVCSLKYTDIFEPFVETVFDDRILDDDKIY